MISGPAPDPWQRNAHVFRNPYGFMRWNGNRKLWNCWKKPEHFLLPNLTIVPGEAPEALRGLPAPTHVFIGGSGGKLKEILTELLSRNRKVRIVLNVITLESLAVVSEFLKSGAAEDAEIVQISVSRSRKAGSSHLMTGQNPVWIISFSGTGTGEEQNAT